MEAGFTNFCADTWFQVYHPLSGGVWQADGAKGGSMRLQLPQTGNDYQLFSAINPDGRIYNKATNLVVDVAGGSLVPFKAIDTWSDNGKYSTVLNQSFAYMRSPYITRPYKITTMANSDLCIMPQLTPFPSLIGNALSSQENWSANTDVAPTEEYQDFIFVAVN